MSQIETTLSERGKNYGSFDGHAEISQCIKVAFKLSPNWNQLSSDKKESLEMIAHKIARIINGNPDYKDSWVDIEGYAHLISQNLKD